MTRIANSFINLPCLSSFWPACLTVSMVSIQVNRNMLKHNRSDEKNVHFKVMIRYPSRRLFRSGNSHTRFTLLLMVPKPSSPLARARMRKVKPCWEPWQIVIFLALGGGSGEKTYHVIALWLSSRLWTTTNSLSHQVEERRNTEVGWSLFTPFKWFLFLWEKQKKMAY